MALELCMVGVVVEDMARAVEFYRRLGVDIPAGEEAKEHVGVRMGKLTFFLTTKAFNARWDPAATQAYGGYRIILEFSLETREALDAKYAEMIGYGYKNHVSPYTTFFNAYFAMIDDPDGNTVLLSA